MKPKPILKNSCLRSGPLVSRGLIPPPHRQKAFGTPRAEDRCLGIGVLGFRFLALAKACVMMIMA